MIEQATLIYRNGRTRPRSFGWHKFPTWVGIALLVGIRSAPS